MQYSERNVYQFTPKSQKSIKTQFSPSSIKYIENTPSSHTQPLSSHGSNWQFLENRRQNQLNTLFNIRKKRLACITNINRKIYQKIATQQSHYSYNKIIGRCQNEQSIVNNSKVSSLFQGKNPQSNSRTLTEIIANNLQKKHIFGHIAKISTNTFNMAKQQFLLNMDGIPQRTKSLQQTIHNRQFHQVGNIIRIGKLKGSILKQNGLSMRTMQLSDKNLTQRLFKTSQLKKRYNSKKKIDLPDIFTNFN